VYLSIYTRVEMLPVRSATGRTFEVVDTDGAELHTTPLSTNSFIETPLREVTGPDGGRP
jgi:hypothetical protein